MLTEFELLIKELESEKMLLDEELQECLRFQDYKYAHYYQKGIWRLERRIERLKSLNQNPLTLDTQHLVDAIIELNNCLITGFSLILTEKSDFYLHFYKTTKEKLYCQIPTESEMLDAYHYVYRPSFKKNIVSLGFELQDEITGIEFSIEANLSCDQILTKLTILMFDILQIRPDASGYIKKNYE